MPPRKSKRDREEESDADEAAAEPVEKLTRKKARPSPAGEWIHKVALHAMNAVELLGLTAATRASSLLFRLSNLNSIATCFIFHIPIS